MPWREQPHTPPSATKLMKNILNVRNLRKRNWVRDIMRVTIFTSSDGSLNYESRETLFRNLIDSILRRKQIDMIVHDSCSWTFEFIKEIGSSCRVIACDKFSISSSSCFHFNSMLIYVQNFYLQVLLNSRSPLFTHLDVSGRWLLV